MISNTLRIELCDSRSWLNLMLLMDPKRPHEAARSSGILSRFVDTKKQGHAGQAATSEPCEGRGFGLLICEGSVVLRALVAADGTLDPSWPTEDEPRRLRDERHLEQLRKESNLSCLVAVQRARLSALLAELQRAVRLDDDLVAQALSALKVLQRSLGQDVMVTPRLLPKVPLPPFELLQKTFDRMLPDSRCAALYLIDGAAIHCSAIVRKRAGNIDLLTDHGALNELGPPIAVRSVKDAPVIRRLLTQRLAPPHVCAVMPLTTWARFVSGDRAAIARAMASRQAVLDPCPTWLLALVGAGAVTDAASRSAKLASKLLSRAPGGGLFAQRAERMMEQVKSPFDSLGLDPFEAMRWGSGWMRRLRPLFLTEFQLRALD
jgi:hypothetical protein